MKNTILTSALLMLSVLCSAQMERTIFLTPALDSNVNLQLTQVSFQHEGYSVFGIKAMDYNVPYVIKYDNNGNVQFAKYIEASTGYYYYQFRSLTDAGDNNYYLLSDMEIDYYAYIYSLRKLNHEGDVLWEKFLEKDMGAGYYEYAAPVVKTDANNNVYLMSSMYEQVNLYKLDQAGNLLWTKAIVTDTIMNKNPGFDVEVTTNGNIICTAKADSDVLLYCISPAGQMMWSKRFSENSQSYSRAFKAVELADGNLFTVGLRNETDLSYMTGRSGFFTMITAPNGDIVEYNKYLLEWDTTSMSYYYDITSLSVSEVSVNPDGSKVLGGYGYIADGNYSSTTAIWLIKLDQNGENTETVIISDAGAYTSSSLTSLAHLDGNRIIFPSYDPITQLYSFTASTLDKLPSCKLTSGKLYPKETINFDPGNIDPGVRISVGGGVTEGPLAPMQNVTGISHQVGCDKTSTFTTAIPAIATSGQQFALYPNPAINVLNVSAENSFSGDANIYDMNGKLIFSQKVSGTNISIPVNRLASSVYMLELKDATGKATRLKFVKE